MTGRNGAPMAGKAGFTLLEMLVALVLVGLLSLALYASLRIGFKAQGSAEAAVGPIRAAEAAIIQIRRDIESALPPTGLLAAEFVGEDETGETGLASDILRLHTCSGGADIAYETTETADAPGSSISMGTYNQTRQTWGDVQKVEYTLERDERVIGNGRDTEFQLVRRVTKNLLAQTEPEPVTQVVCRDAVAFNIRYLDGSEWVDSWDSGQQEDALPPVIEITLEVRRRSPTTALAAGIGERQEDETRRLVLLLRLPCSSPTTEGGGNRFIR